MEKNGKVVVMVRGKEEEGSEEEVDKEEEEVAMRRLEGGI